MKRLPIGISDFKQVIEEDNYFIDKSMLIHELINSNAQVTLIPRPRRFGKTLNLSMLRYFFNN
ncbi:MAG TPA: AAA family ATPase, partial [Campylobacterales bacterium]|nr:AAA family ATPase [Campylobacterales bacterium]